MAGKADFNEGDIYTHNDDRRRYAMLGFAYHIKALPPNAIEIGMALGVTGYETTGKVTGEKVILYRKTSPSNRLVFTVIGDYQPPEIIITYRQLEDGSYPAGTLWWRTITDFPLNFTSVNPSIRNR